MPKFRSLWPILDFRGLLSIPTSMPIDVIAGDIRVIHDATEDQLFHEIPMEDSKKSMFQMDGTSYLMLFKT